MKVLHAKAARATLLSLFCLGVLEISVEATPTLSAESAVQCPPGQITTDRGCIPRPELLVKKAPKYPKEAKRRRLDGTVRLSAVINRDGRVGDVEVVECSAPGVGFEESAVKAVLKWEYEPVIIDGKPAALKFEVVVDFILDPPD